MLITSIQLNKIKMLINSRLLKKVILKIVKIMILMMVFVKIVVNRCFYKRLSSSKVMEKVKNI